MTKIFLDTEFTGLQLPTSLISIGLVDENGNTFYAEFTDYNKEQVNDWINDNVISNLSIDKNSYDYSNYRIRGSQKQVKHALKDWLSQYDKVIIISDCLAYDWVLFCNIFGTSFNIPKNIYYIPFDICTLFLAAGIDPDISREEFADEQSSGNKHNSLFDAIVIKKCYEKLEYSLNIKLDVI